MDELQLKLSTKDVFMNKAGGGGVWWKNRLCELKWTKTSNS